MFEFYGLQFSEQSLQEAVKFLTSESKTERQVFVATPNVNFIRRARRSKSFYHLLQQFDILYADGMPIVWASRLLGNGLPGRVTGADLLPNICQMLSKNSGSVLLAGGSSRHALSQASEYLKVRFEPLEVKTYYPVYGFENSEEESLKLVKAIKNASVDITFLGVGSPKQEEWLIKYKSKLPNGIYIGCGMAIGYIANTVKRAPKIFQKTGCEWVWRILQEPRRLFVRYLFDFQFIVASLIELAIQARHKKRK
jgi:N-acetylglucosaminyldiphosphoundecaprenol N-acetyl-beta-D-mannosaminyltransferase